MLGSRVTGRGKRALFGGSLGALTLALGLMFGCVPAEEGSAWVAGAAQTPAAVATATPQLTDTALIMSDGARLPVRRWLPPGDRNGEPRAVILALHGFNDYSKSF